MNWLEVSVQTTPEGIDPVCGVLMNIGVNGFEIEDEGDFKSFLEENRKAWDYVDDELLKEKAKPTCVKVYVSENAAGNDLLAQIREELSALKARDVENIFGELSVSLANLSEEDWAENWKQYFHPLKVGERVLIRPEWEELTEPTDRVIFTINPGMSFGTGSHNTTRLCIEAIEKYLKPGTNVLDLGCGSGILSVIALLLGANHAEAVDIDPNAVDIAYQNAARNNIGRDRYNVLAGDVLSDTELQNRYSSSPSELVVANIVADVIIPLSSQIPKFMTDDGVYIASGIILPRIDEVKEEIEKYFRIIEIREQEDWAAIISVKK